VPYKNARRWNTWREREKREAPPHTSTHQRISTTAILFYLVRFDWILRHFLWRIVAVVVEDQFENCCSILCADTITPSCLIDTHWTLAQLL
jgi:hypothetical protein